MKESDDHSRTSQTTLSDYWPFRAARFLDDGRFSKAVEICREFLKTEPETLSGRLIYARALYAAGQVESAEEEFYLILQNDSDNQIALKYLADIQFSRGEQAMALANYDRVLKLDPGCPGLKSEIKQINKITTRTVVLNRKAETAAPVDQRSLRDIPFYTETIGDLYLAQGHPRLAAKVFETLLGNEPNSKYTEKLSRARQQVKEKEK